MTDPRIMLGGKEYTIPKLAVAQLREIDWRIVRSASALADRARLTQQARDDFFEVVYVALTRAHPAMTREEFDATGATLVEVLNALPVVIGQTDMFKPAAEGDVPTGEAPSTGTG